MAKQTTKQNIDHQPQSNRGTCMRCGRAFQFQRTPRRQGRPPKYCSAQCRSQRRSQQITTCKHCGASFALNRRKGQRGRDPGFCSSRCRSIRRRAGRSRVEIVCVECGRSFITAADRQRKCCSLSCAVRFRSRRAGTTRTAKANANRTRTCECCGVKFLMRNPSGRARRGATREGRFCSRRCCDEFQRKEAREARACGDLFEMERTP